MLCKEDYIVIKALKDRGVYIKDIAEEMGVNPKTVSRALKRGGPPAGMRISMNGRGRVFDNIFVERLWRTVKYEDIYIKEYATVPTLFHGLDKYFDLYNYERPHQSLGYCTPAEVHFAVNVPFS